MKIIIGNPDYRVFFRGGGGGAGDRLYTLCWKCILIQLTEVGGPRGPSTRLLCSSLYEGNVDTCVLFITIVTINSVLVDCELVCFYGLQ